MALSWSALQSAIKAWLATGASGITVIWANQNGNRPTRPYVTVRFGDLVPLGSTDERRYSSPGGVYTETVVGQREVALIVQAFTADTVGDNRASALLERARTALALTSVRDALNAAGLSPFDPGAVQDLTGLLDADFEGRAVLPVRCYVTETASAAIDYFTQVETTGYTGVGGDPGDPDEIDI